MPDDHTAQMTRRQIWGEIALIFVVFFIQGAKPVPEVNEPYYIGKAIHYWNPGWIENDFFLDSADTHSVFYFTFGWLVLFLSPTALAWCGRLLTWGLLAWSWQRLSRAIVPRPWFSILTAALFVLLREWFHLAGEWVIGGVEAKGFAFVLLFLGLEALARNRWPRAWLLFGAAAAFHVLVGGWACVAAGIAWLWLGKDRPPLRSMLPAIVVGFLLSLPGLLPSLLLDWGASQETTRAAHDIYVFGRLAHHLAPWDLPSHVFALFALRFLGLFALWILLCRLTPAGDRERRFRAFIVGAMMIAGIGVLIAPLSWHDRPMAASLLRFYWFRLSDMCVPLGVSIGAASFITWRQKVVPITGMRWLIVAVCFATLHLANHARQRPLPMIAPADRLPSYPEWRMACDWIAESGNVPADAQFLTPRMAQTFKWYANRREVANWKEIPQDAESIVKWWRRINDIHASGSQLPEYYWQRSLAQQGAWRLRQLGEKYEADYVLTERTRPPLPLEIVYQNRRYVIYRLADTDEPESPP